MIGQPVDPLSEAQMGAFFRNSLLLSSCALLVISALLVLLLGRLLIANGLNNLGSVALMKVHYGSGKEPLSGASWLQVAHDFLVSAITLDSQHEHALVHLGQVYLLQEHPEHAKDVLLRAVAADPSNPFAHLSLAEAWDELAAPLEVVTLYEAWLPAQPAPSYRERLLANYLILARDALAAGQTEEATQWLRKAENLEPDHPYVQVHLSSIGLQPASSRFSIKPWQDRRLIEFAGSAMVALASDSDLDWGTEVVAASYLIWQGAWSSGEQLVQVMSKQRPSAPEWMQLAGELELRRGDYEQALGWFKKIPKGSEFGASACQLGIAVLDGLEPAQQDNRIESHIAWLRECKENYPGDLWIHSRLVDLCIHRQCSDLETLRHELSRLIDEQTLVVELFDVDAHSVEIGPNLFGNGDSSWEPVYQPFDDAALFVGLDASPLAYNHEAAIRLLGFWVTSGESRAGMLRRSVPLEAESCYIISFHYRTRGLRDGDARVWGGGSPTVESRLWLDFHRLPSTAGQWRRYSIVACNQSPAASAIRLYFNIWGMGEAMFDEVSLRQIGFPPQSDLLMTVPAFVLR